MPSKPEGFLIGRWDTNFPHSSGEKSSQAFLQVGNILAPVDKIHSRLGQLALRFVGALARLFQLAAALGDASIAESDSRDGAVPFTDLT